LYEPNLRKIGKNFTEQNFYAPKGWFIVIVLSVPPSDILVRTSSPKPMGDFNETSQDCLSPSLAVHTLLIFSLIFFMNSLNCQFLSKMCLSVLHHQNAGGFQ
jgi:hypothetical protein